MKKYRATTMANGGKTPNGKKKASEKAEVVSRQQAVENRKLVQSREAEDRKSAANIRKSVTSQAGVQSPMKTKTGTTRKFSTTLADAKQKAVTNNNMEQGYSKDALADMLSRKALPGGRKMEAPIFKSGQTGGYATNREISRGAGLTMGRDAVTPRMGVQRAVGAPVAKQQLAKPGELSEETKKFIKNTPSLRGTTARPQIPAKGRI
jgi:hypothetical protein